MCAVNVAAAAHGGNVNDLLQKPRPPPNSPPMDMNNAVNSKRTRQKGVGGAGTKCPVSMPAPYNAPAAPIATIFFFSSPCVVDIPPIGGLWACATPVRRPF